MMNREFIMSINSENMKSTDSKISNIAIHGAMKFDFHPGKLKKYYEKWSNTYDSDVKNQGYRGPETLVEFLFRPKLQTTLACELTDPNTSLMDAGCGTGLVGKAFLAKSGRKIFGSDLSHEMAGVARQTGAYLKVDENVDLHEKNDIYTDNQFDVVTCCGTFTGGHVKPAAMSELIRLTRPGGILAISVRKSYYDAHDFGDHYLQHIESGDFELVDSIVCGPYLKEEDAHYFAFRVISGMVQ